MGIGQDPPRLTLWASRLLQFLASHAQLYRPKADHQKTYQSLWPSRISRLWWLWTRLRRIRTWRIWAWTRTWRTWPWIRWIWSFLWTPFRPLRTTHGLPRRCALARR